RHGTVLTPKTRPVIYVQRHFGCCKEKNQICRPQIEIEDWRMFRGNATRSRTVWENSRMTTAALLGFHSGSVRHCPRCVREMLIMALISDNFGLISRRTNADRSAPALCAAALPGLD